MCRRTELCGEPKAIPQVDAPIREWNAIEGAECRAKEDIHRVSRRPEAVKKDVSSTTKESPRRPSLGWWRVKCWTKRWPARGPYAAGENRLCPLTRGPLAAKGWTVEGERRTHPLTARPRKNEGELILHTKPRGVVVTDLSEESALRRADTLLRSGLASWWWSGSPHSNSKVRNDSEELKRQACWANPSTWSFLVSDCSLDKEEEGVEWSFVLLGMNCLRSVDCVLAERNFSTTELTASPNNPDCEMGASSKNTLSFSRISVRFSHKWQFCGHWTCHRAPQGTCGVLSGSESQVSGSAQLFHSLCQTSPFVHLLKYVRLVGLKDGHRVEGHACLTGRDVGLPDKGGSGPTWLSRKKGAGLPRRRQIGWKVGGQSVLYHRHGGVTLLHITTRLVNSAAAALVRREGKTAVSGIWKNSSFLRSAGIRPAKEPLVEFRRLRLAGLVGPIQRELLSSVRKHVHELRVGRASWPLSGSASAKAGPKSLESEAAVSNISSSPKENGHAPPG